MHDSSVVNKLLFNNKMSHIDFCLLYVCNHSVNLQSKRPVIYKYIKIYSFGLVHSNFNSANWSQKSNPVTPSSELFLNE